MFASLAGLSLITALLGGGCSGQVGDSGDPSQTPGQPDSPSIGPPPDGIEAIGGGLRRLSVHELGNTIEALTGIRPEALGQLPADRRDHDFDRVAEDQTVSLVHVEGFAAVAEELGARLVAERRLDQLSESCPDDILPPAAASVRREFPGRSMTGEPAWATCTAADGAACPNDPREEGSFYFLYADTPSARIPIDITADGRYRVSATTQVSSEPSMVLRMDDEALGSWVLDTQDRRTVEVEVDLTAGSHTLALDFDFSATRHTQLHVFGVAVEGPLDPGAGVHDEARRVCAEDAVLTLAAGGFRRPLSEAEQARLTAAVTAALTEDGFHDAIEAGVAAVVRSPKFLYLVELGTPVPDRPRVFRLSPHELAARLSYGLCEGPPDPELRALADDGRLDDPAVLEAQARRLLDAPCGRATVMRFFRQWLGLDAMTELARDPEVYPGFGPELREAMIRETDRFLTELVWDQGGDLSELYTAGYSWLDGAGARLYGDELAAELADLGPEEALRVELPPERRGLLTQPSLLAVTSKFTQTSPVRRGVFVLEKLLCVDLPSPPVGLDITPPAFDPTLTTRERWAAHSDSPACVGCHGLIDPVGFTMEGFDAIGRYRTVENGRPVDDTGGLPSLGVSDGELAGAAALADVIGQAPESATCFARQWLRFGLGRLDTEPDDTPITTMANAATGASLREALVTLIKSDVFRYRISPSTEHTP
ncbi:DUF1592 domain-containing protein [Haliangium sp.]|uniref:DUF1592 domain-containing protein n=1 Tax=Haliangium sp. TaxID=2663208 RepID=UPI003D0CFF6B